MRLFMDGVTKTALVLLVLTASCVSAWCVILSDLPLTSGMRQGCPFGPHLALMSLVVVLGTGDPFIPYDLVLNIDLVFLM